MTTLAVGDLVEEGREFLDRRFPRKAVDEQFVWGQGSDDVSLLEEKLLVDQVLEVERGQSWARARFDAGFGWIDGPVELGGRGLTRGHRDAYLELERNYEIPSLACLTIGVGMVGPAIAAHGASELQKELLPKLHRGDILACQLFSEPGAGSDVAAVCTRASRDGDEWIIDGEKVWTSNAHVADIGLAICRTDSEAPKHRGLTMFLVDMHEAGVDVRPLRQMTGGSGFNQVFLTGVRVHDRFRLGDVNAGWGVVLTTLGNERTNAGGSLGLGPGPGPFGRLTELVRRFGDPTDPLIRQELAYLYIEERISSWIMARGTAALQAGHDPGPELSILGLRETNKSRMLVRFLGHILGPRLVADTGEWGTYAWSKYLCATPGMRIGGGTDEILRNVVGERVLGLPKEPTQSR